MKRSLVAAAALALLLTPASAFTAADIAKLPQDKVAAIKKECSRWGDKGDFEMQQWCEDMQYRALQDLISRGSIKPNGERL
jgi:hypothetical protein